MPRFEEGFLAFDFGDTWRTLKLDEHRDYRQRIARLEGTKAVDFLGIFNEQELYLIEVKDFRGHRIETRDRLLNSELTIEVAQKVRDSLACIIGAFHTSSEPEIWQPYAMLLCNRDRTIKIALWLENDPPPPYPRLRQKFMASISGNVFKQKLTWLTSHVLVCDSDKQGLPDVAVSNLPHT